MDARRLDEERLKEALLRLQEAEYDQREAARELAKRSRELKVAADLVLLRMGAK